MILLAAVIIGVSAFCFLKGYIPIGVICLFGFSKQIGWISLVVTSIFLFYKSHFIVGSLPLLIIVWNFVGLKLFYKDKTPYQANNLKPNDVNVNFYNYCESYLIKSCNLPEKQAKLALMDPELGKSLDKLKTKWAWKDTRLKDLDLFLTNQFYDAPEMERINAFLDQAAKEYPNRKMIILDYLKSIGHPFALHF